MSYCVIKLTIMFVCVRERQGGGGGGENRRREGSMYLREMALVVGTPWFSEQC